MNILQGFMLNASKNMEFFIKIITIVTIRVIMNLNITKRRIIDDKKVSFMRKRI